MEHGRTEDGRAGGEELDSDACTPTVLAFAPGRVCRAVSRGLLELDAEAEAEAEAEGGKEGGHGPVPEPETEADAPAPCETMMTASFTVPVH